MGGDRRVSELLQNAQKKRRANDQRSNVIAKDFAAKIKKLAAERHRFWKRKYVRSDSGNDDESEDGSPTDSMRRRDGSNLSVDGLQSATNSLSTDLPTDDATNSLSANLPDRAPNEYPPPFLAVICGPAATEQLIGRLDDENARLRHEIWCLQQGQMVNHQIGPNAPKRRFNEMHCASHSTADSVAEPAVKRRRMTHDDGGVEFVQQPSLSLCDAVHHSVGPVEDRGSALSVASWAQSGCHSVSPFYGQFPSDPSISALDDGEFAHSFLMEHGPTPSDI